MGRILDLLKGAAGEKSQHSAIGRWRQAISVGAEKQLFVEAVPDSVTVHEVQLPEAEPNINYFPSINFVAGTPQPFSVTAKTTTSFTITFSAATAGGVSLEVLIQRG